jgi:hypothetical protein
MAADFGHEGVERFAKTFDRVSTHRAHCPSA